jgi:RNA polymerase sigma-70 factor (ECF subfamily)
MASASLGQFRRIYDSEVEFVYHRLRRLGVLERDLEDKLHDVFVVVHRRLADYDPSRPIRPWIAGITMRVASDYRKSAYQRRERPVQERAEETQDGGPDPEQALQRRRDQELVIAALDRLDEERRAVLVLHDIEGHTMREIAEMLDTSANTLYSRLHTAREQFIKAARQLKRSGVKQ